MNVRQLKKKQEGALVRLRPVPFRFRTATGEVLPPIDDQWRIRHVGNGHVELHNIRTDHVKALGNDNIREWRSPDFLALRCQLTLTEREVRIEPIFGA